MTAQPDVSLRICAFESRRSDDLRSLIERHGAVATIAPSMREIPLEQNLEAFQFGQSLLVGTFEIVVFMTGVGVRALIEVLETRHSREDLFSALSRTTVIVRGPKPAAVLREWKIPFAYQVREPNTWRELIELLDEKVPVSGRRVAIQEYGQPNLDLYASLTERNALVTPVPVYRWDLPEDTGPLETAIRQTIMGGFDVLMWTSSFQLTSVLTVAERLGLKSEWLDSARKCVIASIGPTATENLVAQGLAPDLEPEHPKMGHLVMMTAQQAPALLERKRA